MRVRTLAAAVAGAAALATGAWLAAADSTPARVVRARVRDALRGRSAGHAGAEDRLRAAAGARGVAFPLEAVTVRVGKGARTLELLSRGAVVRAYRVGLGSAPLGAKERSGDGRTPEGAYWVCTRNEASRFHLFLGLSYPGPRDAERGRAAGTIDAATAATVAAARAPVRPPWDTALGGEVGIHGCGASDWTAGCVALEDADMDELWLACPLGTPVEISP